MTQQNQIKEEEIDPNYVCESCGFTLEERKCKLMCKRCGYFRSCSDLF
ncbi:hypothetical protein J4423_03760 [Candidatus Pacearchaeota archaeon]|nr:hypothetical protein [Candidatus Pacearchaeota archaeon]